MPDSGPDFNPAAVAERIAAGDRASLARAITWVESRRKSIRERGQAVLQRLMSRTGQARRIGITGVPGAGKSSFIESYGLRLLAAGERVAVLAIDPSSSLSGGSILGDKTRMEHLAREELAFIRPTPAGTTLGGLAGHTREALLLCEAAGYTTVLIETVGVGQSEGAVRKLADCVLMLALTGAGDELQGIKKGILELTDIITVHKADGDNLPRAEFARREYQLALDGLRPFTPGWSTDVVTSSSRTPDGLVAVDHAVNRFFEHLQTDDLLARQRAQQTRQWLEDLFQERIQETIRHHTGYPQQLAALEKAFQSGEVTLPKALDQLQATVFGHGEHG
jgi:LAO/AO transport system kinase